MHISCVSALARAAWLVRPLSHVLLEVLDAERLGEERMVGLAYEEEADNCLPWRERERIV